MAFDKTGTLTRGQVSVGAAEPSPGIGRTRSCAAAAAVEQQSEHPIARAIVARREPRLVDVPAGVGVRALPGLGVEGEVDGARVMCAAPRYFNGSAAPRPGALRASDRLTAPACLPSRHRDGAPVGVIGVADRERDGAADAVEALRRHGVSRVAMLTGDVEETRARDRGAGRRP